jgi:linoleate 10R-lipoxygenase
VKWIEGFFEKVFPGIDPDKVTQAQFLNGLKNWGHSIPVDPGTWTFGGLERGTSGSFDDAGLVQLLTEETEDIAGAFGARNVSRASASLIVFTQLAANNFFRFLPS